MAYQIYERTNPFGKLAEGLGSAFGHLTGEQIQRNRLSSGLDKFNQQLESGKLDNPLKAVSSMLKVPGINDEVLRKLLPIVERQARASMPLKERPIETMSKTEVRPSRKGEVIDRQTITETPEKKGTLLSEEDTQILLKQPEVVLSENIEKHRRDYLRENKYATDAQVEQVAQQRANLENENLINQQSAIQRKQAVEQSIRSSGEQRAKALLQTASLPDAYSQIPGEIQTKIMDDVIDDVREGRKSIKQAEQAIGKNLKDFALTYNNLKKEPDISWIAPADKETEERINGYADTFKKLGQQEILTDILKQKNYGPGMAAEKAYGFSDGIKQALASEQKYASDVGNKTFMEGNKKLRNWFSDKFGINVPEEQFDFKVRTSRTPEETVSFSEKIAKKLTPTDSLDAIALRAADAGYDDQQFYREMKNLAEQGIFEPSPHQQRELQVMTPMDVTLTDLFDSAMRSYNPSKQKGKYGLSERFQQYRGKR
jgi:hypothetical protein